MPRQLPSKRTKRSASIQACAPAASPCVQRRHLHPHHAVVRAHVADTLDGGQLFGVERHREVMLEIVRRYPSITVIDLEAVLNQTGAIRCLFVLQDHAARAQGERGP